MKALVKITILIILIGMIYSLIPVAALYMGKDVAGLTNEQIADKIKNNKGSYFSFIVFGDNHAGFIFDDSAFLKLISRMNREDRFRKLNIDFVANLGDVTFIKGTRWDYQIYNRLRSKVKWPVISLIRPLSSG